MSYTYAYVIERLPKAMIYTIDANSEYQYSMEKIGHRDIFGPSKDGRWFHETYEDHVGSSTQEYDTISEAVDAIAAVYA